MAALVVLVALLVAAPAAQASKLRPAPAATSAYTLTDGGEYAVHSRSGALRIFSETTGQESALEAPAGCSFPGLGAGTLAFACRDAPHPRLYDLGSRTWSAVPPDETRDRLVAEDVSRTGVSVGRVWLRVTGPWCAKCDGASVRVHRLTGAPGPAEPDSPHVHEDLDDERLWAPLCSPLTRERNSAYDGIGDIRRYLAPLVFGRRALVSVREWVYLRRCGSRRRTRLSRAPYIRPQAGGRFITWAEGRLAVAYEIATGRRHRWRIPGPRYPGVSVWHTRRHVFVDKTDWTGRSRRRFVARLP